MPDDFARFAKYIVETSGVDTGVDCSDKNGLAVAEAIMAVREGVSLVKTSIGGYAVPFETFLDMVKNCGNDYGFTSGINYTEMHRILGQIGWICSDKKAEKTVAQSSVEESGIRLDAKDDITAVSAAVAKLGYDLSDEDNKRVHEEVCRVAEKRSVGAKELDAIVATVALQVPDSYKIENYVINNGNNINASAQITLSKEGKSLTGVAIGDGPIDAAFVAIEQIIGHRYELDDFQIQSITEGKEAVGSALVKLRFEGKLYSGNGISTDIIGASIRAYISAVNKIVYEEHNI
jgi:2-isopropylmalate synthase